MIFPVNTQQALEVDHLGERELSARWAIVDLGHGAAAELSVPAEQIRRLRAVGTSIFSGAEQWER